MFWNKLKYKNIMQSGRSMVEIIGVLVVIGVLSIGAVSGYKYGMNKYRANETINELQLRAVALMQQVNRREIVELNMEMGDKTGLGYTTDAWINETNPKYFYISLENVPPEICKQILKAQWTLPIAIYVGNNEFDGYNKDICGNDTYAPPIDFEFYVNFTMIGEYVDEIASYSTMPEFTGRPQQSCNDSDDPLGDLNGNCHACDTSSSVQVGSNGKCSEICPDRIKTGSYCNLKQCSADKPLQSYNSCYACDETGNIYVGENGQCSEICPNRIKSPDGQYCILPCSADKPLMHASGACYACSETSRIYVGQDGQCSEICSNRVKSQGGYCAPVCAADEPLVNSSGYCYACNYTYSVNVGPNGQCSEICPDRIKDANGDCVLNCGEGTYADKPLRGTDGCYACNDTSDIYVGNNEKCNEICANRQLTQAGYCSVSQTCGTDKPLQDNYGKCYACNATAPVYVTTRGKCEAVCSNRVMTSGGYCALPCSADKPLMRTSGECYACSETSNIRVGQDGQCSEICSNRVKSLGGYCDLPCSADKPLMDYWGNCYACNETGGFYVGYDGQCSEICSNRVKLPDSNYCFLPCSSDEPLMNTGGGCYACNTSRVHVGQNGPCSEVCSGHVKTSDGYCEKPCPADKPLMNSGGTCYACDTTENVWQNSNQQCSEICSNRQMYNGYCIHSCGVGIYKTRPLMHVSGICYTCDVQDPVLVNDGECEEVCANRTKRGEYCYLDEEEEE